MCPDCGAARTRCVCGQGRPSSAAGDGVVRVARETKGRKGAGVTVIRGVPLGGPELSELCTQLKKRCGCGGTVKDGLIELQGDRRDMLVEELSKHGWTVKRAGG